jgi:hypothetical protein
MIRTLPPDIDKQWTSDMPPSLPDLIAARIRSMDHAQMYTFVDQMLDEISIETIEEFDQWLANAPARLRP